AEIVSINGNTMDQVVERILPYIPADGENQTRKFDYLKRSFAKYYQLCIEPKQQTFTIVYKDDRGRETPRVVEGIPPKELYKHIKSTSPQHPPIETRFIDSSNTCILTISSFRNDLMEKHRINYSFALSQLFIDLGKRFTQNLIIDLRNNGGGYSEYGAVLNSYLTDSAFQYCRDMIVLPFDKSDTAGLDIPETFEGFPSGIEMEGDQLKWKKHSVLGWREPSHPTFKGRVFFLINGGCVSTTSEFASVAHHLNQGIFIGEEVGGSYKGDSGGVLKWVELPNSHIRIRMAMVRYELAVGDLFDGHGVIPEHLVRPTIKGVKAQKDEVLDYALGLLQTNDSN
ncbi:MAG: hypothetical protein JJ975_13655, partial [Bacteroidia bacterium]|nr:hypothetical protein [Bacteroidia bacterium]